MSLASGPLYRTRQFIGSLRPQVSDAEYAEATTLLGPQLTALFDSMSPRDRRHCLDVCRMLVDGGCDDPAVLQAALLHDSGKGGLSGTHVRLWHRVAYVVLAAGATGLLARVGNNHSGLTVLRDHASIGAALAEKMGAPERVVRMIREHERHDHEDEWQRRLRAADDAS